MLFRSEFLHVNKDTERAGELNQGRTRALARINLAEGGRSEAAERRAKTHQGREDPIACFWLAGIGDGRLHHHRIEYDRGQCVEKMEVRLNERRRTAADQRGFQRGAGGAGRRFVMGRAGRIAVGVMSLGRSRGVTRRLLGTAVADAEVAMREAEHLCRNPNQQCPRRE